MDNKKDWMHVIKVKKKRKSNLSIKRADQYL